MNLGAPRVEVTRGSSLFCWGAAISAVFYFAEGAILNFPSTPFIPLDLSLLLTNIPDLWYRYACYLEQTSLGSLFRLPLSPFFPSACALLNSLAALFPTPVLYFQQLPACPPWRDSFCKTPGMAFPPSFSISAS